MCLELVRNGQSFSDDAVVVDLAVDSEGERAISVNEGLSTSVLGGRNLATGSCRGKYHFWRNYIPTPTILRRSWARTATPLISPPIHTHNTHYILTCLPIKEVSTCQSMLETCFSINSGQCGAVMTHSSRVHGGGHCNKTQSVSNSAQFSIRRVLTPWPCAKP